jgi:hypothetical protein
MAANWTSTGAVCQEAGPSKVNLHHREPRSGVAIQKKFRWKTFHWIASSAFASSQ